MSEVAAPEPTTPQTGKHPSLSALLLGIIIRPRATFAHLRVQLWWAPAILAVSALMVRTLVRAPITVRESHEQVAAMREQLGEQFGGGSEEEFQQAMAFTTSPLVTVVIPIAGGSFLLAAGWFLQSGVLYLASMVLGGQARFWQTFTMTVWAGVPLALRGFLQAVVVGVSGELITTPGLSGLVQPAQPSVEQFFTAPPSTGQVVLTAILGRIDLWAIWALVLLIVGLHVTARISRGKAILICLGYWGLAMLVALVPAVIGVTLSRGFM